MAEPACDTTVLKFGLRCGLLGMLVAILGLPISDLFSYGLLLAASIVLFSGDIVTRRRSWILALAIATVACIGGRYLAPDLIEEGHNVFLGDDPNGAIKAGLPKDVFDALLSSFDRQYPESQRCSPSSRGCWRADAERIRFLPPDPMPPVIRTFPECGNDAPCWHGHSFPRTTFAFSADGIWQNPGAL